MKTPKLLADIEHRAERQLVLLLDAARNQYDRIMHSAEKVSDKAAQRRYVRAAEQTIDSAEKIIAQLRKRIAAARKSMASGARKKKRKAKGLVKKTLKKRKTKQ